MERELHTCLIRYFVQLKKLDDRWKELSKISKRPLEALANRAEQFQLVNASENIEGVEDSVDQNKRERLISKILLGCEEELTFLWDILTQFNNAIQNLKNYLDNLENVRSNISLEIETKRELTELINGTSHRPKLNLLLEWAMQSFEFYYNMYLHIKSCMRSIDFNIEESINNLISAFVEKKYERKHINMILLLTHFLAEENLR